MLPLARISRVCIFCSHLSTRFYASASTPKGTRGRKKAIPKTSKENFQPSDTPIHGEASQEPGTSVAPYKSRIEAFLEDLDASSKLPTLQDLYDMKPTAPAGPDSPNYEQEYNLAVKKVMAAFKKDQLLEFINKLKVEGKLPIGQRKLVQILLDKSWGWVSPDIVNRTRKLTTETVTEEIPLSPALMLALLSEDIYSFTNLARKYNLRLSLDAARLCAVVEGVASNISSLINYLQRRESEMVTNTMELDGLATPDALILQLASRVSGAYIEMSDQENSIRFTATSSLTLEKARRVIQRYINSMAHESRIPVLAQLPSASLITNPKAHSVALFPFMTHRPSVWFLGEQRLFRTRLVAQSTGAGEATGDEPATLIEFSGESADLTKRLPLLTMKPRKGYSRSWIASVGHIIFLSKMNSIKPPVAGMIPLWDMTKQIGQKKLSSHFLPSLPSPLVTSPLSSIITVHRAIYRRKNTSTPLPDRYSSSAEPCEIFLLEVAMEHVVNAPDLDDLDQQDYSGESIMLRPMGGLTRCRVGIEESVDFIIPERPMDMRLTVRELRDIEEEEEPEKLKAYLDELLQFLNFKIDQQPSTPQSLVHEGTEYVLDSSSSIRRTEERFPYPSPVEWDGVHTCVDDIEVISETSLDLESKEKSSGCMLYTTSCNTEEDWNLFIARCAAVTSIPFAASTRGGEQGIPYFSESDE